jgi:hypothetical protein
VRPNTARRQGTRGGALTVDPGSDPVFSFEDSTKPTDIDFVLKVAGCTFNPDTDVKLTAVGDGKPSPLRRHSSRATDHCQRNHRPQEVSSGNPQVIHHRRKPERPDRSDSH